MPLRIVIAEDDIDTAQMMHLCLENAGHEVVVAHDGTSAIDVIRERQPDLVLMDISMPGLSGLDVAHQLTLEGLRTFLVAITGWDAASARGETAAAGFHAHLVKPVAMKDVEDLAAKVARQKAALDD